MGNAAQDSETAARTDWRTKLRASLAVDYAFSEQAGARRDVAGRVRAAQIAAISRFSPLTMAANIVNAAVLLVAMAWSPMANVATLWTFAIVANSLFIYLRRRGHRDRPPAHYVSCRGIRMAFINAIALGGLWGVVPVLFFGGTPTEQLIVTCLGIGMMCAGCFVLAPVPLAAAAYIMPIALGNGIVLLRAGDSTHMFIAVLTLSYVVALLAASAAHAAQFIARVEAQAEAERVAMLDSLTQLPNRTAMQAALEDAVSRCGRFDEGFALFSIDLDDFKSVNDRLGHPAGDQLLLHVTERLSTAVRGSDVFARVGGDEFALLARGVRTPDDAADIAERLLDLVAGGVAIGGEEVRTGLSIGIVLAPSDGLTASILLERADGALYEAKRNGRHGFRLFQRDDDLSIRRRREWMRDLRKALDRKQFHLDFQPIMDLGRDRICGFEALLRWKHHSQGIIPPSDFIPVAESTGLIREIGDFVINEACRIASTWPDDIRVAVNFSLDQFRSLEILQTVKDALERHALPPTRFEIEVTESILFHNEPVVARTMRAFHESNLRLVLDDFGTGYSSLLNLQSLPIDGVKIDRAFITGLPGNLRSKAIVEAVVGLSRALKIEVTAEGVETPEQVATLRALGCDSAQGFWIGRPIEEQPTRSLLPPTPDKTASPGLAA